MINVNSQKELQNYLQENENNYVLIYKKGSEQSDCAVKNIAQIDNITGVKLFTVNVAEVRDIHTKYNVKSVPTFLQFEKDRLKRSIKGCNSPQYYKSLFENSLFSSTETSKQKQQKTVIVYSTPSCPWCSRLKEYLKQNRIKFRDIDVSKDLKAAEQMVKRSGQQGVPQADIGGQIVVGFDKKKIDKLLGIKVQ